MKSMNQSTGAIGAAGFLAVALGTLVASEARAASPIDVPAPVDATPWVGAPGIGACLLTPEVVRLSGTQSAPGSRGSMTLTQPGSPFEITVDEGGFQTFDIEIRVDRMRKRRGAVYVVWAAKPELDEWVQLGTLSEENRLAGRVAWNQFLIFVSEEASADVERWQGPIVLTGLSPSGRLHTMAGHGPFEAMNCQLYF
ncbi:hypothetical protein [Candidatus Palauibacter sp.]|uniref:hypothetical protein n=1 Tax=Candidatus Palauibacter sp. TaxID=3101350 RepID=UPI003B01CB14